MSIFGTPVNIPVIDVHNDNIKEIWPSLCLAIKSATFVGVDTELSGLGDRKVLNAKSIEDRYRGLTAVAKTRSILSLGLSCFKLIPNPDANSESKWSYHIQTFNIIVLCNEDYIVEPASLKFLVDHSFDFNKQYSIGVPYYRGADRGKSTVISPSVRGLFSIIVHQQIPLVIHNGLVDLVFLYQNFYTELPVKLTTFIADLHEMFPHGIYDTKYITDFIERMEASYLEYVFIQCQRENQELMKSSDREVYFKFPNYPDSYESVAYHRCGYSNKNWLESEIEKIRPTICLCFAAHGWCNKPRVCPLIHDVELTISIGYLLSAKQRRNRKRQRNRKLDLKDNTDTKSNEGDLHDNSDEELDEKSDAVPKVETYASVVKKQKLDDDSSAKVKVPPDEPLPRKIGVNSQNTGAKESADIQTDTLNKGTDLLSANGDKIISNEEVSKGDHSPSVSTGQQEKSSNDCDMDSNSNNKSSSNTPDMQDKDKSVELLQNKISADKTDISAARSGCHRAGFDAFMTASILSVFIAKHNASAAFEKDFKDIRMNDLNLGNFKNRIYLSGKDIPLVITKSSFAKCSTYHKDKIDKLKHCGI